MPTNQLPWVDQYCTHQFLEQMAYSDLLIPLSDVGQERVVEFLVDFKDVLDFIEDGLDLLDGKDGLRGGRRGFQGTHRLDKDNTETESMQINRYWCQIPVSQLRLSLTAPSLWQSFSDARATKQVWSRPIFRHSLITEISYGVFPQI